MASGRVQHQQIIVVGNSSVLPLPQCFNDKVPIRVTWHIFRKQSHDLFAFPRPLKCQQHGRPIFKIELKSTVAQAAVPPSLCHHITLQPAQSRSDGAVRQDADCRLEINALTGNNGTQPGLLSKGVRFEFCTSYFPDFAYENKQ